MRAHQGAPVSGTPSLKAWDGTARRPPEGGRYHKESTSKEPRGAVKGRAPPAEGECHTSGVNARIHRHMFNFLLTDCKISTCAELEAGVVLQEPGLGHDGPKQGLTFVVWAHTVWHKAVWPEHAAATTAHAGCP